MQSAKPNVFKIIRTMHMPQENMDNMLYTLSHWLKHWKIIIKDPKGKPLKKKKEKEKIYNINLN